MVSVKSPDTCCISQYGKGAVTDVQSWKNVSVDWVAQDTLGISQVVRSSNKESGQEN